MNVNFINLELVLGMTFQFQFYNGETKSIKLKVRTFCLLTTEKLVKWKGDGGEGNSNWLT